MSNNYKKQWKSLLNNERLDNEDINYNDTTTISRDPFERDYDRVIFSTAFRRLQDKTQLFPLPNSDFIHKRLIHSIEVSSVGRSLASLISDFLFGKNKPDIESADKYKICEIVKTACLLHDIGNPPFGHAGEDAIARFYKNREYKKFEIKELNELIENDYNFANELYLFEGNAHGLSIALDMNFTPAVIGAYMKYPALVCNHNGYYKKFGIFKKDYQKFKDVATNLSLKELYSCNYGSCYSRHPLSYLVEAADDICYKFLDVEDGFHIGLIPFEKLLPVYENIANFGGKELSEIEKIKDKYKDDEHKQLRVLRSKCINTLIAEVVKVYKDKYDEIMNGALCKVENDEDQYSLIKHVPDALKEHMKSLGSLVGKYCYGDDRVLSLEILGYKVIGDLLSKFLYAHISFYLTENSQDEKYIHKLINLTPKQFRVRLITIVPKNICQQINYELKTIIYNVNSFIAGMTDTYALNLYKKLNAIEEPIY